MQTETPRKGEESNLGLSESESGKLPLDFMEDTIKAQNSAMI